MDRSSQSLQLSLCRREMIVDCRLQMIAEEKQHKKKHPSGFPGLPSSHPCSLSKPSKGGLDKEQSKDWAGVLNCLWLGVYHGEMCSISVLIIVISQSISILCFSRWNLSVNLYSSFSLSLFLWEKKRYQPSLTILINTWKVMGTWTKYSPKIFQTLEGEKSCFQ